MNRKKKSLLKQSVQGLLDLIAQRHNRSRGDTIVAEACEGPNGRSDITVYAVRMWLSRGIPEKHWGTVARLAGVGVEDVRRAHGA